MYVMLSQTMCMSSGFEEEKRGRLDEALLTKLPIYDDLLISNSRRREERAKKVAEQRAAKLHELEEKKRQVHDQRQVVEEKVRKLRAVSYTHLTLPTKLEV